MVMKKLLLLPCLFIALFSVAQIKLTIQSRGLENDASVNSSSPDLNLGTITQQDFVAEADFFLDGTPDGVKRSFLSFDLSSIPVGSKINSAKLSLFANIYTPDGQLGYNSSKLRRVTSAWNRGKVTWNTQPATTKHGQISLANSTDRNENYKEISVANLVQVMVDSPATSFGFAIKLDTENQPPTRIMDFSAPLNGYPSQMIYPHLIPKLVIEYTAPGLERQEVTTLSVDLSGSSTEMNIYPNPCYGIFDCNIKSASTNNMTLRVIDMLGRTVYSRPVNTSSMQRVNLPSSSVFTYFVILQDYIGASIVSQ
jgi:hypothetical protein